MNFRLTKTVPLLAALLFMAWAQLPAVTVAYWDFNSGSLARSQGISGSLHLTLASVSVDSFTSFPNSGTPENALPGVPAGRALEFFDLLSIAEDGTMTLSGLNFTGLSDVSLSFAIRSNAIGLNFQSFWIETNTGSGWQTFSTFAEPTSTYTIRNIDLSSITALNNAAGVGIRIRFQEIANVVDVLEFDNVTVTALPEPSTCVLLAFATIVIGHRLFRRPRQA